MHGERMRGGFVRRGRATGHLVVAALLVLAGGTGTVDGAIPASERQALTALYDATNGAGWADSSNWRTPDGLDFNAPGTECTWYGVTCDTSESTVIMLMLERNDLDGTLPVEIEALANLEYLDLWANHLAGPIPSELGNLTRLQYLLLGSNRLGGEIPVSLMGLTNLRDGGLDISYNALHTTDENLAAFLDAKQTGGDWRSSQTTAPEGFAVTSQSPCSVLLSWTAVTYTQDPGGYVVTQALSSSGPWQELESIPSKTITSLEITDLEPDTTYWFRVRSFTDPHAYNDNTVVSDPSQTAVISTATAPVLTGAGDLSTCEMSGIRLFFDPTPGAGGHSLLRDGSVVVEGYESGQVYHPADSDEYGYVIAVQGCGEPWRSTEVRLSDLAAAPPAFSGLASAQDRTPYYASGILLLWDEPSDWGDNGRETGREFRVFRNGIQLATLNFLASSYLDEGVEPGMAAEYRVEAVNGCGLATDGGVILEATDRWGVREEERNALIALYEATQGAGWTDSSNWRTPDGLDFNAPGTECDWYGVVCMTLSDGSRTVNAIELAGDGLSGVLPQDLAALPALQTLDVASNALAGPFPPVLSDPAQGLAGLKSLDISGNLFSGEPALDGVLGSLDDGGLDIRWNALDTTDPGLAALLDAKQVGGDWRSTQTVPPADVTAGESTACSVKISWTPVEYLSDPGGYFIEQAASASGPWETVITVTDKGRVSARVWGLEAGVPVWFRVRSYTDPHPRNSNQLPSEPSPVVDAVPAGNPTITEVRDLSSCSLSGVAVAFEPGPAAVRHDLLVDGDLAVADYVSGQVYHPDDTNRHLFAVRAVDAAGCTADSGAVEGRDAIGESPIFGGITTAEDLDPFEDTGVVVGWAPPSDWGDGGESSGRSFHVYRDGQLAGTAPGTATSFVDTGGTNNTAHAYRVEAVNGCTLGDDGGVELTVTDGVTLSLGERNALKTLYQSCGGAGWVRSTNWRTEDGTDFNDRGTECTWYGVTCAEGTEVHVIALALGGNGLVGVIPEALADLASLEELDLSANSLRGSIPASMGGLSALHKLNLASNRFLGEIPSELGNLGALIPGGLDLRWNGLHTEDAALVSFLDEHQVGGDWRSTQTLPPVSPTAGNGSRCAVIVSWKPVAYTQDPGGYIVEVAADVGGPWLEAPVDIPDKSASAVAVTGLEPLTTYWFQVRSFTRPHAHNANLIRSEPGEAVEATTSSGGTEVDGDVNGDGFTDASDMGAILRYLYVAEATLRPDVTCDGDVGADDLAALVGLLW